MYLLLVLAMLMYLSRLACQTITHTEREQISVIRLRACHAKQARMLPRLLAKHVTMLAPGTVPELLHAGGSDIFSSRHA